MDPQLAKESAQSTLEHWNGTCTSILLFMSILNKNLTANMYVFAQMFCDYTE